MGKVTKTWAERPHTHEIRISKIKENIILTNLLEKVFKK